MAVMDTTKINEPGFNRYATLLGLRFVEWEAGRCVCEVDAGPHLHHPGRIVHGGVAFSLADSAMAHALLPMLEEGQNCSTIEIKISYLSAVKDGVMRAEAWVLKRGRRIVFLEAKVHCGDRLVATATGTFAITEFK
jgi:acyl-CoA thioesterase